MDELNADSVPLQESTVVAESPDVTLPNTPTDADKDQSTWEQDLGEIRYALQTLHTNMGRLENFFQTKIMYDQDKERIIDSLHRELQDYREDLVWKMLRPMATDLTTLYDNLEKMAAIDTSQANVLEGFCLDIIEVLARNGFDVIETDGDEFVRQVQRSQGTVPTEEPELDKRVAARLRKGFRYGDHILRPEIITTYRYETPSLTGEMDE